MDVGERPQRAHPPRGARVRAHARGCDGGVREKLATGVTQMSKDEAIEKCARAMAKRRGFREENWNIQPAQKDLAADIVAALDALGLWNETAGV
jgi:hypothetical protein